VSMRSSKRALSVSYVVLLAMALAVGCSTKEDPSEELALCGNHSCGQLAMVTIDTSKDGFQYLEVALSPDQTKIAFSADWAAIPSLPPEEVPEPIENRQILVIPVGPAIWSESNLARQPVTSITELGAYLIRCNEFVSEIGGSADLTDQAHQFNKGHATWVTRMGSTMSDSLIFWINVEGRDRLVVAGIQDPGHVDPVILFYEEQDLIANGWYFYHHDPELSADGRWLVFSRFGCDRPNGEDRDCTLQAIWVLDMWTTGDPRTARAFPVTSGAAIMSTPTWSPDGRKICFSASVDLVGDYGGRANELFTASFDPAAAAAGDPPLDVDLTRITFTTTEPGDPITGLHNYSPVYDPSGSKVYFVSSRRAPAWTQRGRNLWSVTADGRFEPEILFFSREDDVDPDVAPDGTIVLSSGLGFPTEMLDALQTATLDSLYAMNDTLQYPLTEFEIQRIADDEREQLEAYSSGVMSHIFLLRN
jgi:hypothetical protein